MPGATGTRYSFACPPSLSPRNTCKTASAIGPPRFLYLLFVFRQYLLQFCRHFFDWNLPQFHVFTITRNHIVLFSPDLIVEFRIIDAAVRATAFFSGNSATRYRLRNREHGFEVAPQMPPSIEHPPAFPPNFCS